MLLLGGNASTVMQRLCKVLQLKPPFIKKAFKSGLYDIPLLWFSLIALHTA